MDRTIELEVEDLYHACLDSEERDAVLPTPHDFYAGMGSSEHKRSVEVARLLEEKLQKAGRHAKVKIEDGSPTLVVTIFYPDQYEIDFKDGRWFVDQPQGDCWYFETGDEASAISLAAFFNSPPHAINLLKLRPKVGIEEASLKLMLLGIRGQGVDVVTFAHKGTGIFQRNNLLS